jgi:uncharacterized membrane protein YhaH (DUF805 family)
MGFWAAVETCLRKAVRARGRASQEEFWYFVLFCFGLLMALSLFGSAIRADEDVMVGILGTIWFLLLVPLFAAGIRRLHDTGRGGGWCFLLISLIGLIAVVIMWCQSSQPHENRYGP